MMQFAGDLPHRINGIQLDAVERGAQPRFMEVTAMRFWFCLILAAVGLLATCQSASAAVAFLERAAVADG